MSRFREVELTWGGVAYKLPSSRVMGAIMRIEDSITLTELVGAMQRGKPPIGKIAAAFTDLLRYMGVSEVQEDDVYAALFNDQDQHQAAMTAITALLHLMSPPDDLNVPFENKGAKPLGNAVTPSSKKRTKRPSGAAG